MAHHLEGVQHAAAIFGKTLCTYLELLDMTAPDRLEELVNTLICGPDRDEDLEILAKQATVLGAGTLANRLRSFVRPPR